MPSIIFILALARRKYESDFPFNVLSKAEKVVYHLSRCKKNQDGIRAANPIMILDRTN